MKLLTVFIFFLLNQLLNAQHTIRFEVLTGVIYNFPSKLIIQQEGYETIRTTARYRSEPFHLPPYYDLRLSIWKRDSSAWGLKFTHHKLIMDNPHGDIHHFEITHGYNIFSLNRFWKRKGFILNVSMGGVLANPQSSIRGLYFQGGGLFNDVYYLSGVVGEAAIGRNVKITKAWYLIGEVRATAAWARVRIHSGYAIVPNTAVHFLFGMGYQLANLHPKNKIR